jgi:hypothetical protein
LISVRPFPYDNDVCQVLGENEKTTEYFDDTGIVIGCPTHEVGAIEDRMSEGATVVDQVGAWTVLSLPNQARLTRANLDARTERYADKTIMFYDQSHGTQIAYFGSNAVEALWYPGNTRVVFGGWRVSPDEKSICFKYQTNSYNPVTKRRGGTWECSPVKLHSQRIVQELDGDVFGLASGQVPFSLGADKLSSMAPLISRAKK